MALNLVTSLKKKSNNEITLDRIVFLQNSLVFPCSNNESETVSQHTTNYSNSLDQRHPNQPDFHFNCGGKSLDLFEDYLYQAFI